MSISVKSIEHPPIFQLKLINDENYRVTITHDNIGSIQFAGILAQGSNPANVSHFVYMSCCMSQQACSCKRNGHMLVAFNKKELAEVFLDNFTHCYANSLQCEKAISVTFFADNNTLPFGLLTSCKNGCSYTNDLLRSRAIICRICDVIPLSVTTTAVGPNDQYIE